MELNQIFTCFPGGKHKALTLSYDDGKLADRRLIEIFNKYGLKGTFHINAGLAEKDPERIPLSEIRDLYKGHEVSSHTFTHPTIERCPLSEVVKQVMYDRELLEEACGYPVRGMSYPNGSYSEDIKKLLPACGIEYSRVVGNTDDFAMPTDYLEWTSTCHHSHNRMQNAERFAALNKTQYLYLMYVWGHSYEFDRDNIWDLIESFAEYIGGRDDIWYATNIEIVDYMNAAKNLRFSANGKMVYNPSAIPVWIRVNMQFFEIMPGETREI